MRRWSPALFVALTLALLWLVMGVWRPDTTFHLAPAAVTASLAVTMRWHTAMALPRRQTALALAGGTLVALTATVLLTSTGRMNGPDVLGGRAAFAETLIVIAIAAPVTWWAVRRQPRSGPATRRR